jgi:GT2 family glycosyltransferase
MTEINRPVDVTIIIVSFNTCDLTSQCLKSVYQETTAATFEIIVVDNASTDGSAKMVAEQFPQVRLIENRDNRGFAAANNQAFAGSRGRHILLLNSDTVVLEGAIDKCVAYMDEHLDIGVLGPKVLWPNGEHQSSAFRFPGLLVLLFQTIGLPDHSRLNYDRYGAWDWEKTHDVDVIAGCFLMVRHHIIQNVGALDEDFFLYGEEAEWCHRIKKAGWRIVYWPVARIIHIKGGSTGKDSDPRAILVKRAGGLLLLEKIRGTAVTWAGNVIMTFALLPRIPVWLVRSFRASRDGRFVELLRGHLRIVAFHLKCLVAPAWRRGPFWL